MLFGIMPFDVDNDTLGVTLCSELKALLACTPKIETMGKTTD